jgi:hypothetical protein
VSVQDRFHAIDSIASSESIRVSARTNLNDIVNGQTLGRGKGGREGGQKRDQER